MSVASLRVWDETPQITRNFVLETKLIDFNNMAGKKSILGVIISLTQSTDSDYWVGSLDYRISSKHNYLHLCSFGGSIGSTVGPMNYIYRMDKLIKDLETVQLRLRIEYANGNIGINDFGLVYREYRTTTTDNFDET